MNIRKVIIIAVSAITLLVFVITAIISYNFGMNYGVTNAETIRTKRAKKAENIATALQNCLDIKNGGEIAENLNNCYRHIRFAAKNYIEKEKSDLLSNAHFVSNELLEGWKGMNTSVA